METIGIIAAMTQECKALIRCVGKTERAMLGPFRCYRFQLSGRNCLLINSGIGLKQAINATRTLIAAAHPQLLVSFGVAGAARDDLRVGDVVVACQTFLFDKGRESLFHNLDSLSGAAWHAAMHVFEGHDARLVSGTAVTSRMSNAAQLVPEEMAYPILDMETAGIAQIAAEHKTALIALRAVSDTPREPLSFDLEAMTDDDFNLNIFKAAKMVLRHPGLVLGSFRIIRNANKAAKNAAAALVAVLGQAHILDRSRDKVKIPVECLPLAPGSVGFSVEAEGDYL
jgi:adenosylhomocysteine nucleosidase